MIIRFPSKDAMEIQVELGISLMCWVFLIFIRFLSRNLYIYNKSQGALHCYLPSLGGGANAATPDYPTVELRVFGGLGVRKVKGLCLEQHCIES